MDALGGHLQSTALHWAVRQGHLETSVTLMRNGADPTKTDKQGFNALHLAAQVYIARGVMERIRVIQIMILTMYFTPFFQFGHTLICAYLIAKGMDVDALDAYVSFSE